MNGSTMKAELGKLYTLFIYLFPLIPTQMCSDVRQTRPSDSSSDGEDPRKGLVASYCFAVAFLSLVLRHPAVSAPPNGRIQTHVHTQSKTWRLCILHESSTSEGGLTSLLFSFSELR